MTRFAYFFPYVIWFVISIVLIENSLLECKFEFFSFLAFSLIVALVLEVLRNRWMNNELRITGKRFVLFFILNAVIGIPFFIIIVIASVPLDGDSILFFFERPVTYDSWQQYLVVGYGVIWFAVNAILVKPGDAQRVLLFLGSLVVMSMSSALAGFIFGLISMEIG